MSRFLNVENIIWLLVSEEGTASRRGTDTRTDQTQVRVYRWCEMYCTRDISWTYFHVQTSKFFTDKQGSRSKVSFVQLIRLKDKQGVWNLCRNYLNEQIEFVWQTFLCMWSLNFLCFASGLKDDLGELPRREASRFRSQVGFLIINTLIFWNLCP